MLAVRYKGVVLSNNWSNSHLTVDSLYIVKQWSDAIVQNEGDIKWQNKKDKMIILLSYKPE